MRAYDMLNMVNLALGAILAAVLLRVGELTALGVLMGRHRNATHNS